MPQRGERLSDLPAGAVTLTVSGIVDRWQTCMAVTCAGCIPTSPLKVSSGWDEEGCEELNGHPLRATPIGLS
ncbi:hypothetical protein GCM10014713_65090 [Streptomyces purpureus]|uniref:Uncharacterized protein n=1 Tax=Streptomyces purpureus TaxID=1951 RepID=A0A918HGU3_9ACTN|nr:hypothetical protein GCM10014713_65090 [Streptomyces purpureus]